MRIFTNWKPVRDRWENSVSGVHHQLVTETGSDAGTSERNSCHTVVLESGEEVVIENFDIADGGEVKLKERSYKSFLMSSGNSMWTLAWSPFIEKYDAWYLAVGGRGPNSVLHTLGEPCKGEAAIEIWEVPSYGRGNESKKAMKRKPKLMMRLLHPGGTTWCCKWCPATTSFDEENGRLGMLAAVLGDGSVSIWAIPDVYHLGADLPITCKAPPVASFSSHHIDNSIPCTIDWLPHGPYDLLLVGYMDGCISIIQLKDDDSMDVDSYAEADDENRQMLNAELVQYFPAEVLPIRAAKWFPPVEFSDSCPDRAERSMFSTVGHEGSIYVWDARDEYSPRVNLRTITTLTILDMCWTHNPLGIMAAVEDGSIRGSLLDSLAIKSQIKSGRPINNILWRGTLPGAMWAVDATGPTSLSDDKTSDTIAYGGEDGVIGIMTAGYQWVSKKRKGAHTPLIGIWVDGNKAHIKSSTNLKRWSRNGGLFDGPALDRKSVMKSTNGELSDIRQTIHSIKWSGPPSASVKAQAKGQWLAYGNEFGLIHCIWID